MNDAKEVTVVGGRMRAMFSRYLLPSLARYHHPGGKERAPMPGLRAPGENHRNHRDRLCWIAGTAAWLILSTTAQAQTISDLQKQLTSAQTALTTARTALTSATTSATAVQATILSLQQQVASLQTSVTSLTAQLTAAQTQATTDAATIAALKAQVASLQTQLASLPPCPLTCPAPPPPPVVTPPPPPVNTSVNLTWTPNACPDPTGAQCTTGYRVYWGTASGIYNQAKGAGLSTTGTTFTVGPLATGLTYFFAVTAQNAQAESGFSNEVSVPIGVVTPPAFTESPAGLKVFATGDAPIADSKGAVWTLGPKNATWAGGLETTVTRNGAIKGTAMFLCYSSDHQLAAFSAGNTTQANWYVWSDTANAFQLLSPAVPLGCV